MQESFVCGMEMQHPMEGVTALSPISQWRETMSGRKFSVTDSTEMDD